MFFFFPFFLMLFAVYTLKLETKTLLNEKQKMSEEISASRQEWTMKLEKMSFDTVDLTRTFTTLRDTIQSKEKELLLLQHKVRETTSHKIELIVETARMEEQFLLLSNQTSSIQKNQKKQKQKKRQNDRTNGTDEIEAL